MSKKLQLLFDEYADAFLAFHKCQAKLMGISWEEYATLLSDAMEHSADEKEMRTETGEELIRRRLG